jgi:hypothetical protein
LLIHRLHVAADQYQIAKPVLPCAKKAINPYVYYCVQFHVAEATEDHIGGNRLRPNTLPRTYF